MSSITSIMAKEVIPLDREQCLKTKNQRKVPSVLDFDSEMVCMRTDEFFQINWPKCHNRDECIDEKHRRDWRTTWRACSDSRLSALINNKNEDFCVGTYISPYNKDGEVGLAPFRFKDGMHVHKIFSLYVVITNTNYNQIQFVTEAIRMCKNLPSIKFTLFGTIPESSPEGIAIRFAQKKIAMTIHTSTKIQVLDVSFLIAEYIVENETLEKIMHFILWKSIQAKSSLPLSDLATQYEPDPHAWAKLVNAAKLQKKEAEQGKKDPLEPQIELIEEPIKE